MRPGVSGSRRSCGVPRPVATGEPPAELWRILLVAWFALCVVSVPLAGGSLTHLARLRLRGVWALFLAAAMQVAILWIHPGGATWVHGSLHLVSYLIAAGFVLANSPVPGLPLVGLGGALNFVAIAANGGVMPIRP